MLHEKIKNSLIIRLISSLILGKWINSMDWAWLCQKQFNKGVEKYGHTIDDCPKNKFNWKTMAIEELIDFWVYREKMNL